MPDPKAFRPCLLERWQRWIGNDGQGILQSNWDDVRRDVVRNLEWLLSTQARRWMGSYHDPAPLPEAVAESVLAYGLPPLDGAFMSRTAPHDVARELKRCVGLFEPRIGRLEVVALDPAGQGLAHDRARFRIQGVLLADEQFPFAVDTVLDVVTGSVRIQDQG